MNEKLLAFLFEKRILVSSGGSEHPFEVLFTLANKFGIKITSGRNLASEELFPFVEKMLGRNIPLPFYKGFPETVKKLTPDQILFDQLFNYFMTYALDDFSEPRHSIFEEDFERLAFSEYTVPKEFRIVDCESALALLGESVEDMLKSSRPLSQNYYEVLMTYVTEYKKKVKSCACKDTAIRLILDTGDIYYARFLSLADVVRVVDYVNYYRYQNENIKKLNFKNKDRRLIAAVIHEIFSNGRVKISDCFERRADWAGILHHIHYKPKTEDEARFVALMRGRENHSTYAYFERAIEEGDIKRAVDVILEGKGAGGFARNLNYLISRAKDDSDLDYIIENMPDVNATLMLQLLNEYHFYEKEEELRTFTFTKFNLMKIHHETEKEGARRKSYVSEQTTKRLYSIVREKLKEKVRNRIGKVYIAPEMYKIAIPLQETTTSTGLGVLPKGSRLPIDASKKIRAFTYWERVNDVDLSIMGVGSGTQIEFSWRSLYNVPQNAITWSGDEVSGYEGGSEYYDINIKAVRKNYPKVRYLVFCNNVYTGTPFSEIFCRAGYMLRDKKDTGEIFEYKTVESSFDITCDSTFAYLFAIDLETEEFVWLNLARDSSLRIAGVTSAEFLVKYLESVKVISLGELISYMACELVSSPDEAEVVFSDESLELAEGTKQIHSYDVEKIIALL